MSRISRADVEHVARLARLALTPEEVEQLTGDLGVILDHADDVAALDLADVPPTAHPLPLENVLRPDERRPSLDRDEVLAQAPAAEDGRFRVPRVMSERGEAGIPPSSERGPSGPAPQAPRAGSMRERGEAG